MTQIVPQDHIEPTIYVPRPASDIPPRKWLYGRHLISGFVSLTVAPGGVGKSSMLLVEALSMATGYGFLGDLPIRPLRVWVWNGEDPREEIERRVAAACIRHNITPDKIEDRLMFDSGRDVPIEIVRYHSSTGAIASPIVDELIEAIQKHEINVLIIDPFVTSHKAPENDTTAMNAVVAEWRKIADVTGCAIELVHHTTKAGARSPQEADIYASRGAGAVLDGVRSARILTRMTRDQAKEFGIEGSAAPYFRVDNGKANLAPPEKAKWRKMEGVSLDNGCDDWIEGDTVGVCVSWEPPDFAPDFDDEKLIAVQNAINTRETPPMHSDRAKEWVGYLVAEVLKLDVGTGLAKAQRTSLHEYNRKIVKGNIYKWIANGRLEFQDIYVPRQGKTQRFVLAGEMPVIKDDATD